MLKFLLKRGIINPNQDEISKIKKHTSLEEGNLQPLQCSSIFETGSDPISINKKTKLYYDE